jgi:hypothetical protein
MLARRDGACCFRRVVRRPIEGSAADHELIAPSPNGTEMIKTIAVADSPRWLVVNYWYSPDDSTDKNRHFELTESDKPIGFA